MPGRNRPIRTIAGIRGVVATMGRLVAWGQLRSAGRQGSAIADELIDYARRGKWQAKLQAAAAEMAEKTLRDAAGYNAAYDDGVLRLRAARPTRRCAFKVRTHAPEVPGRE